MNNRFEHLFKPLYANDINGKMYELVEEGLHGKATRVQVMEDSNGCLRVVSHAYKLANGGHQRINRKGKKILAHRYVWQMAYNGGREILEGYQVNHLCDVPDCINPEHLYLGTHADNMRDKIPAVKANRKVIWT
jgi:hypothetical protein